MNSFHIAIRRAPPEVLGIISSHLDEQDVFSASQVCQYWRSTLTSFQFLWTRVSCRHAPRTIACLERRGTLPIQLRVKSPFSSMALDHILPVGKEIVSLSVNHDPDKISELHPLFTSSRRFLERLQVHTDHSELRFLWTYEKAILGDFPSLRELFVTQHIIPVDRLTVPNLVHLALEHTGYEGFESVTVQTILDMLSGCPLLETLLLNHAYTIPSATAHRHSSVHLPHLRSIEVGLYEVHSGLITYLDFPNVAVGFREMYLGNLLGDIISPTVATSMQQVLRGVDIHCITLAVATHSNKRTLLLVRFEGPHGSLEISGGDGYYEPEIFFDPQGVLFSHSPHIENVTELRIAGCHLFDIGSELNHITAAMPNIETISFLNCDGPDRFALLTSGSPSSPPFPRLERFMVLGSELGLKEMAEERRELGVPLKTLVIGRSPPGFEPEGLGDHTALRELVADLQVGCPVEIPLWQSGNEIAGIWPTSDDPELVRLKLEPSCSMPDHTRQHLFRDLRLSTVPCRFNTI